MYICSENKEKPIYQPGLERWSAYKTLWTRHWVEFQKIYPYRFKKIYGPLTEEKKEQVRKLIQCGKFQNGFQRHTCLNCGTVLVVPFTCKSRLCLSCARKRLFGWSLNLSKIMNTSLKHTHVTFTIPGKLCKLLFKRNYEPEQMITLTAELYKSFLKNSAHVNGKEFQPGILATLHKSGNSLNYNPHVHLISTQELVDTKTGEIIDVDFLPYKKIRFIWQKAFLQHLLKQGVITEDEKVQYIEKYKNGFHVYFQPIKGSENDVLFRTAQYIATGYFHNTQILEVNNANKTITFQYRCFVDRKTKKKHYARKTMHMYDFMVSMIFFLPDKHRKMIRYYGIYTHNIEKKITDMQNSTWKQAIEHSFQKDPEKCPECSTFMIKDVVFSFLADREIKKLVKTHGIVKGYFIPYRRYQPP